MSWKFWEREQAEEKPEAASVTPNRLTRTSWKEIAAQRAQALRAEAEKAGKSWEVMELQEQAENLKHYQKRLDKGLEQLAQEMSQIRHDIKLLDYQVGKLEDGQEKLEQTLRNLANELDEVLNKERPEASQAAETILEQIDQIWEKIGELERRINSLAR